MGVPLWWAAKDMGVSTTAASMWWRNAGAMKLVGGRGGGIADPGNMSLPGGQGHRAKTIGERSVSRERLIQAPTGVGVRGVGTSTSTAKHVLWGGYTWQYWRATRSVKPAEYQFFGVGTGSRANRSAVTA
jgi:hypothetical protein